MCEACHTIEVRTIGFALYRGKSTVINYDLYSESEPVSNIKISLSGPLREYAVLKSRDKSWTGNGFTYISKGGLRSYQVVLSGIPDYLIGMNQLKTSITYDSGAASDLTYVMVLPSIVAEQGRPNSPGVTIGSSRVITKMVKDGVLLPVEVSISVW